MSRTRAAVVVGAWAVGVALGSTFGLILWAIDRGNQRAKIGGSFPDPDYDPLFDGGLKFGGGKLGPCPDCGDCQCLIRHAPKYPAGTVNYWTPPRSAP